MPKQGQRAEINTFIQGLITEASPLNFPPNASREEENFELFRDGTRKRRLGLDLEPQFYFRPHNSNYTVEDFEKIATSSYKWECVGGDSNLDILVFQVGSALYFYNLSVDGALSAAFIWAIGIADTGEFQPYGFASIDGMLVVVYNGEDVKIISFNPNNTEAPISLDKLNLKVRDLWGVEVNDVVGVAYETDVYYRGAESLKHDYNLRNQSWGLPRRVGTSQSLSDPITAYINHYSKQPSNSETVWAGLQYQPVVAGADPYERIYPNLYAEVLGAGAQAAKGFFIIDALNRGASRSAQINHVASTVGAPLRHTYFETNADKTLGGPSVVSDFAGRVFYAGFSGDVLEPDARSPNLGNYLLFSQLVKNKADIAKCYQEGDPTTREGSDVVDTDGGWLRISEAKQIIGLHNMSTHLVVFASNGVWAVSGGGESGFSATNFKVNKISSYGTNSPNAIVNYGGSVVYWGDGGIYLVSTDKFAQLVVNSLSQTTIQTYYNNIPQVSKEKCAGVYDEDRKRIIWFYRENGAFTENSVMKELILDQTLNCFYVNRISKLEENTLSAWIPFYYKDQIAYFCTTSPEDTIRPNRFTFAYYHNTRFLDWETADGFGVDAKAFLLTGSQIAGDSAIVKQTPYLVMHFRKTESETNENGIPLNQSGCLYRTQWDWANKASSHKFSALSQAYRYRKPFFSAGPGDTSYDNGFETVVSKNKIRGRGRAFALYFETEPDKDCNVLGWNLTINGNALA